MLMRNTFRISFALHFTFQIICHLSQDLRHAQKHIIVPGGSSKTSTLVFFYTENVFFIRLTGQTMVINNIHDSVVCSSTFCPWMTLYDLSCCSVPPSVWCGSEDSWHSYTTRVHTDVSEFSWWRQPCQLWLLRGLLFLPHRRYLAGCRQTITARYELFNKA